MLDVSPFKLFLFDFDGLLVNTERWHYEAYRLLCKEHGCDAQWSFEEYCGFAHRSHLGPQRAVYGAFPELKSRFPDWSVLYKRKTDIYSELVSSGRVALMPGVASLLEALDERSLPSAVVTHSQGVHLDLIRRQWPVLDRIPHWIKREDYSRPKPDPECYLKAIEQFARPGDRVIGFEDTPRGLQALCQSGATAVLVASEGYPCLSEALKLGALHLTSLEAVCFENSLNSPRA